MKSTPVAALRPWGLQLGTASGPGHSQWAGAQSDPYWALGRGEALGASGCFSGRTFRADSLGADPPAPRLVPRPVHGGGDGRAQEGRLDRKPEGTQRAASPRA